MTQHYKVAEIIFDVTAPGIRCWADLEWHYTPFATDETGSALSVTIVKGSVDTAGRVPYFSDTPRDQHDITMRVYKDDGGGMTFELQQPDTDAPTCWMSIDAACAVATVHIDEDREGVPYWKHISALTSAMQLAYILASEPHQTLLAHASSVVYDRRAYLFIAKSGTGKSTHCRMWLENIPDTFQLNDDHPVVRVGSDGKVTAYGSPWSGKTHCYKALSYPLGAIVRIKRAPANAIQRQSPVMAYASISTSFSGFKWHSRYSDLRHRTLERIVSSVPCYVLECLPDPEAAVICSQTVTATL